MSHAHPTVDVVGIGNALVDVISHESPETLAALGSVPGSMTLVDDERSAELYAAMGPAIEASGGSAANTMVGVAGLGGSAHYIGRVRDDQLGKVFAHDLRSVGVGYSTVAAADGPATGTCLIMVTPDGQRTMHTCLGASAGFGPDDVDPDVVRSGSIVYLEGYLFDRPEAQAAFAAAAEIAHEAGRTVALTLSDSFCVDRHRAAFRELVEGHIDLLFANEAEILALYETDSFDDAVALVRGHCAVAAITRSEAGAVVVTADEVVSVPARPVAQVVDTTGAGDLFAAGFLFGTARGLDLVTCAHLGAVAAAEVISHVGPRPEVSLAELARAAGLPA